MLFSSLGRHALIAVCACMTFSACISPGQRVVTAVSDASRRSEPLPLPHRIDETLTIESAYRIQERLVRKKLDGAPPAGFKAGLTTTQSQSRFRASAPIAGVLLPGASLPVGSTLRLSELRGLTIETEVAMRIGTPIDRPVRDIAALREHMDGIAPAIELPTLFYHTPAEINAIDLVATNVAAAHYIAGEFVAPEVRDPNDASPRLTCEGKEASRGEAREAMGDQWRAALWLVNTLVDRGWTLERGQVLLTGTLGRMVSASAGDCSADYGSWGTIGFHIVP